jgi:hypothetical protein
MNKGDERLRFVVARVQNRLSSKLGDIWRAFMLHGAFAWVLGICALVWPTPHLRVIVTSFVLLHHKNHTKRGFQRADEI